MLFYILFGIVSVLICGTLCVYRFNSKVKINDLKIIKIVTIIFLLLSFFDVFLPDAFSLRYIWDFNYLKENHNAFHAIIRAFNAMAVITLPFAVFYKKQSFSKITAYIILPSILVNVICYFQYIEYYTSPLTSYASVFGTGLLPFLTNRIFRSFTFGILMLLELIISLYIVLYNLDLLKFKDKKEIGTFFALFGGLFFSNIPIYTFQQVIGGTTDVTFNFGDPMHIIFIFIIAIEGVLLTLIFKNKSYENKYILLLVMAISLMFQYNTFFKTDGVITATRYPLQLCNIAGLFLIITLLTKSEKMFHFTVVVNVTGALIAIVLCDSTKDVGVLYCMNIHYMVEHINVLLIPLLGLVLHVFEPLKKKDIKDFGIGFTAYYIFVLFVGTIFNGLEVKTGNSYFNCNYLFMFQKSAAVRLVGDFIGKLFDLKITLFNYYNLYLAQIFVYIVFMIICSLIYFGLYLIFKEKKKYETQ